ncbi:MAG TPA: hypothetical protein VLV17_06465 [Anaeromyxobacteraceae bacterium]|nr:hypothetical protein [Anaeromyxobacteraceae bacterium]
MNKQILVALLGILVTTRAGAAVGRGGDYSLLGAETVAPGNDVLSGAFGWPDTSFMFTHGLSNNSDVGVRLSFIYGFENRADIDSQFGLGLGVPLRFSLAPHGTVRFLFHIDPGLRLYTYSPAWFGFQAPFGINLEFPAKPPLRIGIGADFNATFFVTGDGTPAFVFGPLIGPYLEYRIDPRVTIGVDTRFGAIVDAAKPGTDSGFGLRVQGMLAYRM